MVKVPSFSVLTPNSDKYKGSVPKPCIGPVVIELSLFFIVLTATFLAKGPPLSD